MRPSLFLLKALPAIVIFISANDISILPVAQVKTFGVIFDTSVSLTPLI